MKSVIIAFSNPLLIEWTSSVLRRSGYTIEYVCKTGGDVTRISDFCSSMVVVNGFQFTDMTAADLKLHLNGRLAMVTILLPHQLDLVDRSQLYCVPYPLSATELVNAVEHAEKKAAFEAVAQKAVKGRSEERSAEEKLMIIRAKQSLMDRYEMTESQAHRFLQKSSMDRGLKIVDAARMVLDNTLIL